MNKIKLLIIAGALTSALGTLAGSAYAGGGHGGKKHGGHIGYSSGLGYGGGYIGIDGASISVDNSLDGDLNPRGMRLRLGTRISHTFDIEVHLGSGHDSSAQSFDKFRTTFAGVYLKGYLPIGDRSALYGMAGGAAVELTQTIDERNFSDDRSGFSYGFGLETQISANLDLSGDYVRYSLDDEEYSAVDAFTLGLKWYF